MPNFFNRLKESVVDAGFPLTEHSRILVFISLDFSLILHFSKFGGLLLLHFLSQCFSLPVILVGHLLQDAHLVTFSCSCFLSGSSLKFSILLGDRGFNFRFFFSSEPLHFLLFGLLEKDILLSGLVDIFEQVDSSLLLSLPLSFSHFVLSFGLLLNKFVNKLLISVFVALSFLVVLL